MSPTELIKEAIAWRHHLHCHPEVAFKETRTADFIAARLEEFGLQVHRGLGGTGVVGTLKRGTSSRTLAIRADMDALPITEMSGVPYASTTLGVMHACGHDGHVAMALAAARACSRLSNLDGTVHFIFQPAEENEGGAARMMEEGLFNLFPTDAIYALHNWPSLPLGSCVARDGAMMAAFGTFEIQITGRGCHAAMPHEGTDTILAGSHLITALHTITSRNVDPIQAAVVSATQIHAGDAYNVIPGHCVVRGTTRWFDDRVGEVLEHRIAELVQSVPASFGCKAQLRFEHRYPATINDPAVAKGVRNVATRADLNLTVVDQPPSMAAEDFAFMLKQVPGCYFWLGTGTAQTAHGLHSPNYDFNDAALPLGINLWVEIVKHSLTNA